MKTIRDKAEAARIYARQVQLGLEAQNDAENTKLIRHIESGGIRTLLYGGNANFYHLPSDEYDAVLSYLEQAAGERTLVIPSAGPAFGTMMDQAKIIRRHRFPTSEVAVQRDVQAQTAPIWFGDTQQFCEPALQRVQPRRVVRHIASDVRKLERVRRRSYDQVNTSIRPRQRACICHVEAIARI